MTTKKEKPLRVAIDFDEAMRRAVRVKPEAKKGRKKPKK